MMNIKILNSKDNKLIGRKEIEFEMDYEKMPKREEILEMLSKVGKYNKEFLIIKEIKNVNGIRKSKGIAYEYENKEKIEKFEPKYRIKRWKVGKEEKKEEQKAKQ